MVGNCPVCDAKLPPSKAHIVQESGDVSLVHITCSKCKTHLLVGVVNTSMGLSSVVLITDLNYEDVCAFKDFPYLTADNVIEVHQMMKDKNLVKDLLSLK